MVLLESTWDINRLSTLTPTFRKVFKAICVALQGSRGVRESNIAVLKAVTNAVGRGALDFYVENFLQSNLSGLGRVTS